MIRFLGGYMTLFIAQSRCDACISFPIMHVIFDSVLLMLIQREEICVKQNGVPTLFITHIDAFWLSRFHEI